MPLHTGWYVCAELLAVSRQLHDGATVHTIALLSRKLALVPADMWIVSITGTLLQKMPCSSTKCHQIIKNGVWHATSASIIIGPLLSVRLQIHTNSYTHCDTDPWTHQTIVCTHCTLYTHFMHCSKSFSGDGLWPPHFPDMKLWDFYSCGMLKVSGL